MTESNELRITLPDLGNAFQIHATGMALINCFSADLYDFINKSLIKSDGPEWLQTLEITAANVGKTNFKDPALLLKRLTENQNGEIRTILRKPLNSVIPSNYHKEFYNLLDQLLADRHTWFHQEIDVSSDELKELAVDISKISYRLEGLPVTRECRAVLDLYSPPEAVSEEEVSDQGEVSEIAEKIIEASGEDEPEVGSPLDGPFLGYTYTLHITGEIRDRKTDQLLSEVNAEVAKSLGALLLARKPNGGRLRMTQEGILAAFFGDTWGYLAKVEQGRWFGGHLDG